MLKAPCKNCSDRLVGGVCHISCPKYIEWKGEREKLNEKISAERKLISDIRKHKDDVYGVKPYFKR